MELNNMPLFNNKVDAGLRLLVLLTASYPNEISLEKLVYLDYFLVHANDLNENSESLHVNFSGRGGEIFVRREIILSGISFFIRKGLISEKYLKDQGIFYSATEQSRSFLDCLSETYTKSLMSIANQSIVKMQHLSLEELQKKVPKFTNLHKVNENEYA